MWEKSFNIQFGMLSGPEALDTLTKLSCLAIDSVVTVGIS